MRLNTYLAPVVLLATLASSSWSQGTDSSPSSVSITSGIHRARVFIDSVEVGTTPLVGYRVLPGIHTICAVAGDGRKWSCSTKCEQLEIEAGKEYSLRLDLPRLIRITSEPYGAQVVFNQTVLGETPYIFSTDQDGGTLRLVKEGYDGETLLFDRGTTSLHIVLDTGNFTGADQEWRYLENEESESIAPVVITASTAVLTGATAAYLKIRADNLYDDYRSTGDRRRLDQIRTLDVASGIALGLSQISLAVLTYLLVSR